MTDLFWYRKPIPIIGLDFYRKLAPYKFGGIYQFQKPAFVIRDPDLLKYILIKDFDYFQNHAGPPPNEADALSYNLFNLKGNLRVLHFYKLCELIF